LFEKILKKYHEQSDLTVRFRSRALLKVDLACIVLFSLGSLLNFTEKDFIPALVEFAVILLILADIRILQTGRYRTAANLLIGVAMLSAAMVIFSDPTAAANEGFVAFTYLMPSLVSLALFGYSLLQAGIVIAVGELILIISLFARSLPQGVAPLNELLFAYLPSMLLFGVCCYFVLQIIKNNRVIFTSLTKQQENTSRRFNALNSLVEKLKGNLNMGEKLNSLAENTLQSVERITARLGDMDSTLGDLMEQMKAADSAQEEISSAGNQVSGGMDNQTEALQTSSAAIEQIAAAISNLSKTMQDRMDALNTLKNDSRKSEALIKQSGRGMDEMLDSNSRIIEITSVIEDVGNQTNLLAMNASIEAAHAGEIGRGFAVVAGEIRKLAEATNTQSRQIKELLERSTENSRTAADQSRSVLGNFEAIMQQIDEQNRGMTAVSDGLAELARSAGDITSSVSHLRELNSTVNSSVSTMSSRIEISHESVRKTTELSEEVSRLAAGISSATEELMASSRTLAELGGRNTENMQILEKELEELR